MPSKFVVIEGLIGVGKTTLCRILRDAWGAHLVLEPAEDNPFLAAFYGDPRRYAFPAQMFYLASRYAQQLELQQPGLFEQIVVSDYLILKDRIFAEQTLSEDELSLYDRFTGLLSNRMPTPDFVVFLDAPTETVMSRIARRDIAAEQVIEPEYLDELRDRYYALWDRYEEAPVYVLETTNIPYADDEAARAHVISMIEGWLEGSPVDGAPEAYNARPTSQIELFGG